MLQFSDGVPVNLLRDFFGEGACVWAVLSARCRFRPSSKSSSRSRRGCASTPSTFKVCRRSPPEISVLLKQLTSDSRYGEQ